MVKKTDVNDNILKKIDELTNNEDMRNFLKEAMQIEYAKRDESERAIGAEYSKLIEKYGKNK